MYTKEYCTRICTFSGVDKNAEQEVYTLNIFKHYPILLH